MNTIKFETNKPVELRLRSITGKPVDSKFGGMQRMFATEQGAFYVSETVGGILAEQLRKLNIQPGELIEITKAEVNEGGDRRIRWQVAKIGFAVGEQRDGTFAVATPEPPSDLELKLKASLEMAQAKREAQRERERASMAAAPDWSRYLIAQSCHLVDAYAAVLKHAARHENVRGEDVRSLFLSAFINVSKQANGGRSAA